MDDREWRHQLIAGVTHLTMEAPLEQGARFASQAGFWPAFTDEVHLPAAFEQVASSEGPLPLALHTAAEGVQLEVVHHAGRARRDGAFTGVFGCAPPENAGVTVPSPAIADAIAASGAARAPCRVSLSPHGAEAWFDAAGGAGGLRAVVCRVRDLAAEAGFWERFARVRWGAVAAEAAWGAVPSPVPRTRCLLILVRDEDPVTSHQMNDGGFPSIGVASTAIEVDYRKALSIGAVSRAAPIQATVGLRRLRLALIASPGGAPIELLGADRAPRLAAEGPRDRSAATSTRSSGEGWRSQP